MVVLLKTVSVGQWRYDSGCVGEVLGGRAAQPAPPPPHHLHAHQEEHHQPVLPEVAEVGDTGGFHQNQGALRGVN